MKKYLILVSVLAFGLLGNSFQTHASYGTDYYSSLAITITSDPSADADGNVVAKVGDSISLTSVFSMTVSMGTGHWLYSPFVLSCDNTDDPMVLKCNVIGKGDSKISYSIDVMTDWDNGKASYQVYSAKNTLTVHVGDGSASSQGSVAPTNTYKPKVSVGKPDLTIKAAKASLVTRKVKGISKKQYKIGVTVANKSAGDAVGDISYSYNSNAPILVSKSGLKAHMSKKVFLYVDATEKGQEYVFTADPGNAIDESNEANNTATRVVGK
jgi:hypothetical protein